MARKYKILTGIVAVFILLLIAVVIVVATFDWNRLKPYIDSKASDALGRPFAINGDLSVAWHRETDEGGWRAWVPWPQVTANDIVIGNTDWAKAPEFATLKQARFSISPLALPAHRVVIRRVQLTQPAADLERRADGRANWDFGKQEDEGKESTPSSWTLDINEIGFDKGRVGYHDVTLQADLEATVDPLGKPVPFADLAGAKLAGGATAAPRDYVFGWTVKGRYKGLDVSGQGKAGGMLSLQDANNPFPLQADVALGHTKASVVGTLTDPRNLGGLDLRLKLAGNSMSDLYPLTGVTLPDTPPYSTDGHLMARLHDAQGSVFEYKGFNGKVGDSDIHGDVTYVAGKPRPKLTGKLTSQLLRFADLGPLIGANTGKTAATDAAKVAQAERASAAAAAKAAQEAEAAGNTALAKAKREEAQHAQDKVDQAEDAQVRPPTATGGQTRGRADRARGRATQSRSGVPAQGNVAQSERSAAAPQSTASGKQAVAAPAAGTSPAQQPPDKALPVQEFRTERWRDMDADVTLDAKRIVQTEDLPLTDLQVHVILNDGMLTLQPLRFGMAGGSLNADIQLDGSKHPMPGRVKIAARRLQLKRLFPNVKTMQKSLGELNGDAALSGTGNSVAALLGTANGDMKLLINDGVISRSLMELAGLNVGNYIVAKLFGDDEVKINCGAADIGFKDGVATPRVFVFDTENTLVEIQGTINFKTEAVDLDITPHSKGLRIISLRSPLYVAGTLKHPKPGVKTLPLAARGAGAVALGVLLTPVAGLLALIVPSAGDKENECSTMLREVKNPPKGMAPKAAPKAAPAAPAAAR